MRLLAEAHFLIHCRIAPDPPGYIELDVGGQLE